MRDRDEVAPKLNVVIDALSAREGGGQTYLRNILAFEPPDDLALTVVAPRSLSLGQLGNGTGRIDVDPRFRRPFFRALWYWYALPPLLRRLGADVLFCPGGASPTRRVSEWRLVTMSRNMLPFEAVQRARYPIGYKRARISALAPVLLRSMAASDLVIFLSEHARQVVEERAGSALRKTVLIPHGIAPAFRAATRNRLPRPSWLPGGNYLLYVSNVEPYKAQVEVVRGYAQVRQRQPEAGPLVLVGRESSRAYARQVRREVARLGLASDVRIVGHVAHDELPAVYAHAHIGIFASMCENCPNVLLESMACGLPLVVSSRPPMPEFAGDAVEYFDPERPEDLAETLVRVLDDTARQLELGRRAEAASRRFDWQKSAQGTWQAIRSCT